MKELTSWRVENENNVKYALRVFEGWLSQADKFADRAVKEDNKMYQRLAFSIADRKKIEENLEDWEKFCNFAARNNFLFII